MNKPRYWLAGTLVALCVAVAVNAQTVSQVVNTVAVGGITGLGTGVATALGINVGSAGAPVTFNGALGTPSSGTLTNATGLPNAGLVNMTDATVKGRALGAGTGVPTDLTATQPAAIVGSVGGALKSKTITITRDLTAATGNVAYTGMGFQPTACLANGSVAGSLTQYTAVFSTADSSRSATTVYLGASVISVTNTLFLLFLDLSATHNQAATIASYDADGLTLTWTKTNTPTGTAAINITCFR